MKNSYPRVTHGGLYLGILLTGLVGSAAVATYSLALHPETHPGRYTADPDGPLVKALTNRDVEATASGGNGLQALGPESREQFESDPCLDAEASAATETSADETDPTSLVTANLPELIAPGTPDAAIEGFSYASATNGGAGLQQRMTSWSDSATGGAAVSGAHGNSGGTSGSGFNATSGGGRGSGPNGNSGGRRGAGLDGLFAAEFGNDFKTGANGSGSAPGIYNRTETTGNFATSAPLADSRSPGALVYKSNPQPIIPPSPVPDGGTTMLLLSLSLGGLGLGKRWACKS
jgi:hypothetical protein